MKHQGLKRLSLLLRNIKASWWDEEEAAQKRLQLQPIIRCTAGVCARSLGRPPVRFLVDGGSFHVSIMSLSPAGRGCRVTLLRTYPLRGEQIRLDKKHRELPLE